MVPFVVFVAVEEYSLAFGGAVGNRLVSGCAQPTEVLVWFKVFLPSSSSSMCDDENEEDKSESVAQVHILFCVTNEKRFFYGWLL